jgi:hypothetical protein
MCFFGTKIITQNDNERKQPDEVPGRMSALLEIYS